jgi:hypothetical protein
MIRRIFTAIVMVCAFSLTPLSASAASPVSQIAICTGGAANFFGFQPWYSCLPKSCPGGTSDGSPKLCKLTDIYLVIFPIVDWILKAAVFISAGMMFFMLFKIATYSTAISGIRDAVVGLVISVLAVAILTFVVGAF